MVKINIEKRTLFLWATIFIVLIGLVGVYAYGGSSPSVMGHTMGEINGWSVDTYGIIYDGQIGIRGSPGPLGMDLRVLGNIGAEKYCDEDGTNCKTITEMSGGSGSSWWVPSDVKVTTSSHNGDFGGYQAMYNWIQSNGCSGYHVCDSTELTRYLQLHSGIGEGWYNSGIFSSDDDEGVTQVIANDCYGWDYVNPYGLTGPLWQNGRFRQAPCPNSYPVLCCK